MEMSDYISEAELKRILLSVRMPGRYVGGEYGSIKGILPSDYKVFLSYPDLYEIGMSNLAVRLLYQEINALDGIGCERVFSPAPDFEEELRNRSIPLFSLESSMPLSEFDMAAFSIGTELSGTNLLNILELGNIPIMRTERGENDPVVIAGGPAISNPLPFGMFLDAVYIGEAEEGFLPLLEKIGSMKRNGADRGAILDAITSHDSFWASDKENKTTRSIWRGFGRKAKTSPPVPNIRTVQDYGVIEIMRGCPNGCRFCHAGNYYKPYREKPAGDVLREADELVKGRGYRSITLSSLSSGDYSGITELVYTLNRRFSREKVSFSLPSMRVNSFTLPLLAEISRMRKSGLTFAVETPELLWQQSINKEVPIERTIEILNEAKRMGWKIAKFYFMIGLPSSFNEDEPAAIVEFLNTVRKGSGMNINVSIGTFIPKPHTPFQRAPQLTEDQSFTRITEIKNNLSRKFFKTGYHSPFASYLEGIISRGGESAGALILEAFRRGARLDAWDDYLSKDIWRSVIEDAGWDVEKETCRERDETEILPWNSIDIGVSDNFFRKENEKASRSEITPPCDDPCNHNCGVCGQEIAIKKAPPCPNAPVEILPPKNRPLRKVLFSFCKAGRAVYLSHINVMTIFERSLLRGGFDVKHTEGFNPKPKLEFAHPLSLGISSDDEIAGIEIFGMEDKAYFTELMNNSLPDGFRITRASVIDVRAEKKRPSLMSRYWGSEYYVSPHDKNDTGLIDKIRIGIRSINDGEITDIASDQISCSEDRKGLKIRLENTGTKQGNLINLLKSLSGVENVMECFDLRRTKTFSKGNNPGPYSFFDVYGKL